MWTCSQVGRPSGKVHPLTVNPMLQRIGMWGSSGFQREGGSISRFPRGEEGGVKVGKMGGGGEVESSGKGERFCPGENEG